MPRLLVLRQDRITLLKREIKDPDAHYRSSARGAHGFNSLAYPGSYLLYGGHLLLEPVLASKHSRQSRPHRKG
jgi:hypothetical protein